MPQVTIAGSADITVGTASSYTATPQDISEPFQSMIWKLDDVQIDQGSLATQVTASSVKSYVLSVTITGADGQSATGTTNLTASKASVGNNRPAITNLNIPTGNKLKEVPIEITFMASDPDGDDLSYKIRSTDVSGNISPSLRGLHNPSLAGSSGVSIGKGGQVTHTVTFDSIGTYDFKFIVDDGKERSAYLFSIRVSSDAPPTSTPAPSIPQGGTGDLHIEVFIKDLTDYQNILAAYQKISNTDPCGRPTSVNFTVLEVPYPYSIFYSTPFNSAPVFQNEYVSNPFDSTRQVLTPVYKIDLTISRQKSGCFYSPIRQSRVCSFTYKFGEYRDRDCIQNVTVEITKITVNGQELPGNTYPSSHIFGISPAISFPEPP